MYDGDTYKVIDKGKFTIIPLANVDAPEMSRYYGNLVRAGLSKLNPGKKVKPDVRRTDRYGRTIEDLTIDGKSLASLLVINGWAWEYVSHSINHELSRKSFNSKTRICL